MADELGAATGLVSVVRAVRAGLGPEGHRKQTPVLRRAHATFCRAVAAHYEGAPALHWTPGVAECYRRYIKENLVQYRAARAAGIDVRPWTGPGQPYRDSRELIESVRRTGVLHVFLTRTGHGPDEWVGFHPLRSRSGVVEHGVELAQNDVLRAVHDLFGHVLHGCGFDPCGELTAARAHWALYSPAAQRALFTEQVGQICWFFYGPHGRAAERGHRRPQPYPLQKVFLFPHRHLAGYARLFEEE